MHIEEWILNSVQYTGLLLAGASTLWTATHVESKEVRGRKKLTRAGKISVSLIIFGLLINVGSKILQDRLDSVKNKNAEQLQQGRFNRQVLAAKQLSSLDLSIVFTGVNRKVLTQFDSGMARLERDEKNEQGGVIDGGGDPEQILRHRMLYVFLRDIGRLANWPSRKYDPDAVKNFEDREADRNVLALISLDEPRNIVLPIGLLDSSLSFDHEEQTNLPKDCFAAGIGYNEFERGWFGSHKLQRRVRSGQSLPELATRGDSAAIQWTLDPATLAAAVDIGNVQAASSADLPDQISMMILFKIKDLPFGTPNFAKPTVRGFWSVDTAGNKLGSSPNPLFTGARLMLVPNRDTLVSSYHLTAILDREMEDVKNLGTYDCEVIQLVFTIDR